MAIRNVPSVSSSAVPVPVSCWPPFSGWVQVTAPLVFTVIVEPPAPVDQVPAIAAKAPGAESAVSA